MPAAARGAPPQSAIANPYGTYLVEPTEHGLRFQVSVRDPRNNIMLLGLFGKSVVLALFAYTGLWRFLCTLFLYLIFDALLYPVLARTLLHWIEVRPDGLVITPKIDDQGSERFFDRRGITNRQLECDAGLSFRYGIYDIRALPAFANEREFEIFEVQFEQAIARLWHQENLDR